MDGSGSRICIYVLVVLDIVLSDGWMICVALLYKHIIITIHVSAVIFVLTNIYVSISHKRRTVLLKIEKVGFGLFLCYVYIVFPA